MSLSNVSMVRLSTCHPLLYQLVLAVMQKTQILVVCGYRDQVAQEEAFNSGKSKLNWPTSRHNSKPSEAVDLIPLPMNWNDIDAFKTLAQTVKDTAAELNIQVEWGGDWATFKDFDHFQLKAGTFT